jgi:hypothetical protein
MNKYYSSIEASRFRNEMKGKKIKWSGKNFAYLNENVKANCTKPVYAKSLRKVFQQWANVECLAYEEAIKQVTEFSLKQHTSLFLPVFPRGGGQTIL